MSRPGAELDGDRPTERRPAEHRPTRVSFLIWLIGLAGLIAVLIVLRNSGGAAQRRWAIVAVVTIVAAVAIGLAIVRRARRVAQNAQTSAAQRHATDMRLVPVKSPKDEIRARFAVLPEVRKHGTIKHAYRGERLGRPVYAFEHTHVIHTGNAVVPVQRTIYAIGAPAWPRVGVTPRHAIGRVLARVFGRRGLELDLPEFNRRFAVRAEDEDFAVVLLSHDLQRHILTKPGVTWRIVGGLICLIYHGPMRLSRAPASLERLEAFARLVAPELEHWRAA